MTSPSSNHIRPHTHTDESPSSPRPHTQTCSGVPPTVKLLTAQAASFWVLNSPADSWCIMAGTRLASITIWCVCVCVCVYGEGWREWAYLDLLSVSSHYIGYSPYSFLQQTHVCIHIDPPQHPATHASRTISKGNQFRYD